MVERYQHTRSELKMERRELFGFLSSTFKEAGNGGAGEVVRPRPPYYNDADAFGRECRTCEAPCVASCQEQIIVLDEDSTPYLDFSKRGCSYCDECAKVCPKGLLDLAYKRSVDVAVVINQKSCISWEGVMCFSCKEPCLEDAIDFQAMFMPSINEKCTNCGFCIGRCPVGAIEIKRMDDA